MKQPKPRLIALGMTRYWQAEYGLRIDVAPFNSAMSMLVFYMNRAGKKLDPDQKRILQQVKQELRRLYDKY